MSAKRTDPKNVTELAHKLVDQEQEIRALKQKIEALQNTQDEARMLAAKLTSKANKQSTFSNYEVKQYATKLTKVLSSVPLLRR